MYLEKVYWQTKDGQLIEIGLMSTTHLRNCIALIEKSIKAGKPWRKAALPYLREELAERYEISVLNLIF